MSGVVPGAGFAPTYGSFPRFPPASCPCVNVSALLEDVVPGAIDNAQASCLWTDLQGNCLQDAAASFGSLCAAWDQDSANTCIHTGILNHGHAGFTPECALFGFAPT